MAAKSQSRSVARLAAVQALFQLEAEGTGLAQLLKEFHDHRLGSELDDVQYAEAERDFFDAIVSYVARNREAIDALIAARLSSGWTMARLDPTMLQILRAGVYELMQRPEISVATIISEYLDVAHAFFDRKETGFVNGILDRISAEVRG